MQIILVKPSRVDHLVTIRREVESLLLIARKAYLSGGYVNQLLGDACIRRSAALIGKFMVVKRSASGLSDLVASLRAVSSFADRQEWVRIIDEDFGTEFKGMPGEAVTDWESLQRFVMASTGQNLDRAMAQAFQANAIGITQLLDSRNLLLLMGRAMETAAIIQVRLPALNDYLDGGGELSELSPDDIRAFTRIFGERGERYQSPINNINRLNFWDLAAFVVQLQTIDWYGLLLREP